MERMGTMKKEFAFISVVLLVNICSFADRWTFAEFTKLFPRSEIEYKVIEDADVYNQRTEPIDKAGKGETFTTDRIALVYFDKKDNNRPGHGGIVYGYKDGWILSKDVVVNNSDVFEQDFVTKSDLDMEDDYSWIPVWWNNVVVSKEPRKLMESYSKWLQGCPPYWYEDGMGAPSKILIRNTMLSFEINNSSHLIKIRSIKKENDAYIITGFPGNYFTNETLEGEMFQNFPKADAEGCVVLKLEKNGKRLFLYDDQNGSLIAEFMMASKEWIRLFEDYIYENRRPAGLEVISNGEELQSDSLLNTSIATAASENLRTPVIAIIPKPAPDLGKTAVVTENLRLRTDDKTTAEVVTTLAAGTRVKVLAPGREDTIDGIASSWVQVSVLDGAKDKDGNAIEAGTVGWLFGGYLSEAESAESERANEDVGAKQNATLPILPIAAGGAVLAVLLAVVILTITKKKKADNR